MTYSAKNVELIKRPPEDGVWAAFYQEIQSHMESCSASEEGNSRI